MPANDSDVQAVTYPWVSSEDAEQTITIGDGAVKRRGLVGLAAAALFGGLSAATALANMAPAYASPSCCCCSPQCSCCNRGTCCATGCTRRLNDCNKPLGYWTCCNAGFSIDCVDWFESNGTKCICAQWNGGTC